MIRKFSDWERQTLGGLVHDRIAVAKDIAAQVYAVLALLELDDKSLRVEIESHATRVQQHAANQITHWTNVKRDTVARRVMR